ncbi:MAG: gliding motility-associated C-terminal domain-containing protein [Flavobacteriales bacterium]
MLLRLVILIAVFAKGSLLFATHTTYPLVQNKGQWPQHVLYAAELDGGKIFLEGNAIKWHFIDASAVSASHRDGKSFLPDDVRIKGHVYEVKFEGADADAQAVSVNKQKSYYNFFLGKDESKWVGGCSAYSEVIRKNFYPGIDFKFYNNDFFLKYDFIVSAGADAAQISMKYDGAKSIKLENGRLCISTSVNEVYEQKPLAWQIINGEKNLVTCEYHLIDSRVTFHFPKGYDKNYELVIDPQLIFSSYSGSTSDNFGYTATYDEDGYLYSGSSSFGQGYPTTVGAYQVTHAGGDSALGDGIDMALTKYNTDGTSLIYSTFLGGSGDDLAHSIIVNSAGELLVYGCTGSDDFPVTGGAVQINFGGGTLVSPTGTGANFPDGTDIVVVHFSAGGNQLLGATYLGGSANDGVCTSTFLKKNYADEFRGEISLDENENIIIASSTFSTDWPVMNALQAANGGMQDAVIAKLNPGLTQLIWSTYIGGSADDSGFSLTTATNGDVYMCGGTRSTNLNATTGVQQTSNNGGDADGYIVRLSSDAQNLLSLTYWGAAGYDQLYFIEMDDEGNVYVYGQTNSNDFNFIINAGYGTDGSGNLLTKFSAQLDEVIWSTVFGTGDGKPNLSPSAFLVDYCNRIYVSGWGVFVSANNPLNPGTNLFPMNNLETTADAYDNSCSTGDFYMAVFDDDMNTLTYATFFGGSTSSEHVDGGTSRFDRKGVIYQSVCAGCGGNDDFPTEPDNVWSSLNGSTNCNNGVYKFDFQLPLTVAAFEVPPSACVSVPVQFTNNSSWSLTYLWDFGDDSPTSTEMNPLHTYMDEGTYTITLIVTHNNTCNGADTLQQQILIVQPVNETLDGLSVCPGESTTIGPDESNPLFEYDWQPAEFLDNSTVPNPLFTAGTSNTYVLTVNHDNCVDTYTQLVNVPLMSLSVPEDTTLCDDAPLTLAATFAPSDAAIIWSDQEDFSNQLNDNTADEDISVLPIIPTTYYVQISVDGCELTDEVHVNLVSFQTVVVGDFTACENDTVMLQVQDPNAEFIYQWQPEELVLNGQNTPAVEVFVAVETEFFVYSITPFDCTASDSVTVSVSLLNGALLSATAIPATVVEGQSSQLNVQPDDYTYQWAPPTWLQGANTATPVSTPLENITYTVEATDGECVASTQVTVRVVDFVCGPPGIFVPNTFTPNADEQNEKMYVRANNVDELYFTIYNRWGQMMWETRSLAEGWDGTFQGRELDPDVYVYYLQAKCTGGSQYFEEGNITLVR